MNKDYIILDINDNIIEAIKTDKLMNTIDETKLNLKEAKKINIIKFINYCKNCNVIINNSKDKLSYLLKLLYENKIYDSFKFKYIDIKSIELNKDYNKFALGNINLINNYLVNNLDNFFNKYKKYARVFRGLNYSKYLCDIKTETNKYYGYIVDFSSDKYVSYYSVLKELRCEYYNVSEIEMLKLKGAVIIMNVGYLCDEILKITNCYSVYAVDSCNVNSSCKNLLNGISNYIKYKKDNNNLKLVLWGNINNLKKTYSVVDTNLMNNFISMIDVIKDPWEYFDKKEIEN